MFVDQLKTDNSRVIKFNHFSIFMTFKNCSTVS